MRPGAFFNKHGKKRVKLKDKIITTIVSQYSDNIQYALDGGTYYVGSCINWLVKGLKVLSNPEISGTMAFEIRDNRGVYFIPSLSGISAPYWEPNVKGAFVGLSLDTSE